MTNPRRVLELIPNMGGGGAERQLTYLASGLVELGWEVHVGLNHAQGANLERLERSGAVLHPLGVGGRSPLLLGYLQNLIRTVKPALVQTWLRPMDIFGGLACLSTGTPWVLSERASDESHPPGLRTRLRSVLGRHADAVVSNSEKGRRYWTRLAGPDLKQYVVPNGVPQHEIDATEPIRVEEHGVPTGRPLVLFAGRLAETKNIAVMLTAFAEVVQTTEAVCVLAGAGPLEDLVRRAAQAHPGRICYVGYSDRLWAWLRRADLFVSVSHSEGNPNAVLEAACAGCPLVVSDIAEHREFLDETSAVLVPTSAAEVLADAIATTLADSAGRAQRAAVVHQQMRSRSTLASAQRYADIYLEVLAARRT